MYLILFYLPDVNEERSHHIFLAGKGMIGFSLGWPRVR